MRMKIKYLLLFTFFISIHCIGQNKVNSYEYWFDNDYAGKTIVPVSPVASLTLNSSIPTTGILPGLHVFHLRFKDTNAKYSTTVNQFFQKLPSSASSNKTIVAYEYWYDNDYAAKIYQAVTPQSTLLLSSALTASTLTPGMHALHIRFKDDGGGWSNVWSQFIQKVNGVGTTNEISAYEYWYDNAYAGKIYQTVTPQSTYLLTSALTASSLTPGLHAFHIRFKDGSGWSNVTSQFIQKVSGGAGAANEISAYEYWYDNDYAGKIYQTVTAQSEIQLLTTANTNALTNGLHVIHIRFKDNGNSWSSVNSNFFQKNGESNLSANKIVAYRYWFDMADSIINHVKLSTPTDPYLLNTPLNLAYLHKGNHTLHFQFQDTLQNWSCVITDTFAKFPTVVADFTPNKWALCDSGTVSFTNHSFDADTFRWVFDNGTTSNISSPSHFFNTYGTHHVILIAYDTTEDVTDSLTLDISVVHHPIVNLGNDTAVCPPGIILNAWNSNSSYIWSTASADSAISVSTTGNYHVTVTNQWGCINADSVHIIMNPAAVVNLGNDTTICTYSSIVLDAGTGFAYYNWCTGETTQTITALFAGLYCVEVTNSSGCHDTDTIHVFTDPCTAIQDFDGNDFISIYPNPTNGLFYLQAETDFSDPADIAITDLSGRNIYSGKNVSLAENELISLDLSDVESGVYMFYMLSSSVRIVKKIVINH